MTGDAGATAVELVVLTPALVVCLLFVVFAGRLGQAQHDVAQAAAETARVLSLARDGTAVDVREVATRNLTAAGVACRDTTVDASRSDWGPGGTVHVTVRCDVDLTDVAGTGLPGHRVVSGSASEVIDTFRGDG